MTGITPNLVSRLFQDTKTEERTLGDHLALSFQEVYQPIWHALFVGILPQLCGLLLVSPLKPWLIKQDDSIPQDA